VYFNQYKTEQRHIDLQAKIGTELKIIYFIPNCKSSLENTIIGSNLLELMSKGIGQIKSTTHTKPQTYFLFT
jgi:hypothetical protein